MKVFKAALCLALTAFIFLFPTLGFYGAGTLASAEAAEENHARYAYVDMETQAYFCTEKNGDSALFLIPQTYCVEILGEEGDWYKVTYAEDSGVYKALKGYCLKSDVVPCESPLENLYLNLTVKVVYRTDEVTSLLPGLGSIEFEAAFYGAYEIGKSNCSYVLCNGYFGYIPRSIEDYPLNPLPSKPTLTPPQDGGGKAVLIAAISVIAVAAAAILILYFTGKKAPDVTSKE